MKKIAFIIYCTILLLQSSIAQTTYYRINEDNDGATINLTCPISNTRFADDGSNSTHYSNDSDRSITFCAPSDKLLKFDFGCGSNLTIERIHPSDTLFIYNGSTTSSPLLYAVTGNPSNSDRLPYFDESSDFVFLSPSNCITFRFKSSTTNNQDGWDACITCVDPIVCGDNEPASDLFGAAPYICNLDGYCGTTSGDFGADFPVNLNPSGGNCTDNPGRNFLGTIENNSWLKFIASSTNVVFDFNVPLGGACVNGVQVAIFEYDGTNLTRMSPCELSDGSQGGDFQLTATGLTVGNTYYIMIDGNAGDVCNYTINANTGVATLDAGPDQLCAVGSPVNLLATGPTGSTYTWNSLDGVVVNEVGASQTFNPATTTTYVVELTGGAACLNQTDTVLVTECSPLPIDLISFEANCSENSIHLSWSSASEFNNYFYSIERAGENGIFEDIAFVSGNINSNSTSYYSFIDNNPFLGINYYKLFQTDYDGTKTFLGQIEMNNSTCLKSGDTIFFNSFNPIRNNIELKYSISKNQKFTFNIFDAAGKVIFNEDILLVASSNKYVIELDKYIAIGIYFLRIENEKFMFNERIFMNNL